MAHVSWNILLAVPVTLGVALVAAGNAAAEPIFVESAAAGSDATISDVIVAEPVQLAQVTSVSELSDVQPGDWAFTALQRLVEEYGCLEGYPDRTYRGNSALTRYEFAAGLNACLDVVVQLIGSGSQLDEIRRLQEEFAAELATVRGDVDALQTDVAELEANQFSTTTKLRGQLDTFLVVPFDEATAYVDGTTETGPSLPVVAGIPVKGGPEADATVEYRARLILDASFTGEDRLRLRLQASDDAGSLRNTERGLTNQIGRRNGLEDNVAIDDLFYSFPIGKRINAIVGANSVNTFDLVSTTVSPFDGPSVAFAGRPEFYLLYPGGNFGAAVNVDITKNLVLDVGYASSSSNVNAPGGGLFNNSYYIAQLNLLTDGFLKAAVTYIDSDRTAVGTADNTIAGLVSLNFGKLEVAGHYAATQANGGGDMDSYMGGVAINDFLGTGNKFGVYGGISPAIARDPLLVEAYYQIAVNKFLTLTPSVIYTSNDSGIGEESNTYAAMRAAFKF